LKGETEVKTFVGGLASIISKVIILIFLAFKLQAIYEQQATSKFLFVMSNVITKPNDYVFSKERNAICGAVEQWLEQKLRREAARLLRESGLLAGNRSNGERDLHFRVRALRSKEVEKETTYLEEEEAAMGLINDAYCKP